MYNKEGLKKQLSDMGIKSSDTVMVHASMKAIGEVEGGAETVLDALMEYLEDGLLVFPAHTWAFINETYNVFDPKKEETCVGVLPNLFLKRKGVVRSLHPTHSVAAYGAEAAEFVAGEEDVESPCAPGGCYDRLRHREAKILLLGVTHAKNTFLHCVEELLLVPERLSKDTIEFYVCMPDGSYKECQVRKHYNEKTEHISEEYVKLEQALFETKVAKAVQFGEATSILCDANGVYKVMSNILSHQLNCIMELDTIPVEWWN